MRYSELNQPYYIADMPYGVCEMNITQMEETIHSLTVERDDLKSQLEAGGSGGVQPGAGTVIEQLRADLSAAKEEVVTLSNKLTTANEQINDMSTNYAKLHGEYEAVHNANNLAKLTIQDLQSKLAAVLTDPPPSGSLPPGDTRI